jgi:hypothetical protein
MSPIFAATAMCAIGAVLLRVLVIRDGFAVAGPHIARGLTWSAGFAVLFGMIIVPADLIIVHTADMNIPFPASVLFYPVIGFMVESLFHVLPLCVLLTTLRRVMARGRSAAMVWTSLIAVAALEPAHQTWTATRGMPFVGGIHAYAWWAVAFDGVHVLAISLISRSS